MTLTANLLPIPLLSYFVSLCHWNFSHNFSVASVTRKLLLCNNWYNCFILCPFFPLKITSHQLGSNYTWFPCILNFSSQCFLISQKQWLNNVSYDYCFIILILIYQIVIEKNVLKLNYFPKILSWQSKILF